MSDEKLFTALGRIRALDQFRRYTSLRGCSEHKRNWLAYVTAKFNVTEWLLFCLSVRPSVCLSVSATVFFMTLDGLATWSADTVWP